MGHTPTKFGETGWGVSHTGTKEVDWVRREKQWRAKQEQKNGEKKKKKTNRQNKQKSFFFGKSPMLGLKLRAFPDGPRGRPLDHRRGLIRSTWPSTHQQKTYLPYVRKIVLEQLTPFSVVQIVLLYYHSSTIPGCATESDT